MKKRLRLSRSKIAHQYIFWLQKLYYNVIVVRLAHLHNYDYKEISILRLSLSQSNVLM